MNPDLIFEGNCWKFGNNIPTDMITPTRVILGGLDEMAKHVLESLNPEFPKKVQKGDILVAGRDFGCSSGRALAAKALKATGISIVLSEGFARTFYRNAAEIGLPMFEVEDVCGILETGDRLKVDLRIGLVENLTAGKSLRGNPPSEFLMEMVEAGGLIPLLKMGSRFFSFDRDEKQ